MKLTFDVIITTYNRPKKVHDLCMQVNRCELKPEKLIVVDSSDEANSALAADSNITYIRSKHKSQPYQRYLGSLSSTSDIVVYFDDDLFIQRTEIFTDILHAFSTKEIAGLSVGIAYENVITKNTSDYSTEKNITKKIINFFNPRTKQGEIGVFGQTTSLSTQDVYMQYLIGPVMCFRKEVLKTVFDETLFALFEQKIAMGEDKVISLRASKQGRLYFLGSKIYLMHPAEESTYFSDAVSFYAKLYYSRLWIASEYNQVHPVKMISLLKLLYIFTTFLNSATHKTKRAAFVKFLNYIFRYGFTPRKEKINAVNYFN